MNKVEKVPEGKARYMYMHFRAIKHNIVAIQFIWLAIDHHIESRSGTKGFIHAFKCKYEWGVFFITLTRKTARRPLDF